MRRRDIFKVVGLSLIGLPVVAKAFPEKCILTEYCIAQSQLDEMIREAIFKMTNDINDLCWFGEHSMIDIIGELTKEEIKRI